MNILIEVFAKGIWIFKTRTLIKIINAEQPVAMTSDIPIPIHT